MYSLLAAGSTSGVSQFLFDFFGQFVGGLGKIFGGIFNGIVQMFNVVDYIRTAKVYATANGGVIWVLAIVGLILVFALVAGVVIGLIFLFRKIGRFFKNVNSQGDLVKEVNALNREVMRLNLEKDKILSMKVSQIGLNPNEISSLTGEEMESLNGNQSENAEEGFTRRFFKLANVDEAMKSYVPPEYDYSITLPELCERYRFFACSRMRLFYDIKIIRLFFASFASTRLIILQGISGTGKTSLPYSFGKFIMNDSLICSVQPSWRDRAELFGYFNEFTKKYNETELLRAMYEASYKEDVFLTILDEMNIARVEYYFAEMLSILEMPSRDEWIVDLVPSSWDTDPEKVIDGKLRIPANMWYVGTANNDDSTFAITDKVYDRAMPIDINTKGIAFDAPDTEPMRLSYIHLENLLNDAKSTYIVSQENMDKITVLDDYVIEHFRLAFGNRIVKQLKEFVPAYVGCGGTEVDGLDYVLAKKIFRKFEALNLAFIRDEIDGLVEKLSELWGEENMQECKSYLLQLKKLV